jgi:hypothetical protein
MNLRPGLDLLRGMATALPDDVAAFAECCRAVPDWRSLLDCAGAQGLRGLLYHEFGAIGYTLPGDVRREAARQHALLEMQQRHLREVLDGAVEALVDAGVRVVLLKGPVLAERLYPTPWLRPSQDLDILICPEDLDRAATALTILGYALQEGPSGRHHRRHDHHLSLYHASSPPIELHFRLHARFGVMIESAPFVARAVPLPGACGSGVGILCPEDEFLYLARHAAIHRFGRLSWLYELKLFLRRYTALDWRTLLERSRHSHSVTAVRFTADELRQLGVPAAVLHTLSRPNGARRALGRALLAANRGPDTPRSLETLLSLIFETLLCDRPRAAVSVLCHGLGRITRRRIQRRIPRLVPREWSG